MKKLHVYNPDGAKVRVVPPKRPKKEEPPIEPEVEVKKLPFSVLLSIGALLSLPFLLFALLIQWAQTEDHNKVESHGRRRW